MRALAVVCMLAGAAWADNTAKEYFEAGSQAYDAGDYATAIRSLEMSYKLAPKAQIAFSLAQAYRKQWIVDQKLPGLQRAVDLYQAYIDQVATGGRREDAVQHLGTLRPELARLGAAGDGTPAPVPMISAKTQLMVLSLTKGARASIAGSAAARVPLTREVAPGEHKIHVEAPGHFAEDLDGVALEGQLVVVKVDLKAKPALVTVKAKSGADISIDGIPRGSTPLRKPLEAKAGKHFLAVTMRGHHPFTRAIDVERGAELTVDAGLRRTPQRRASFWVLGGAGVLAIGGGVSTLLALRAQGRAEDLDDKRVSTGLTEAERRTYNDALDRRRMYNTTSVVLYGGAAVAGITGILLYLLDTPRVEPVVAPSALGANYTQRF